jgi:hypothetical protein
MYWRDYISEHPGGGPCTDGTTVKLYRTSDDAELASTTTTDGFYVFDNNGNPGPCYAEWTVGSDTRRVYGDLSIQEGHIFSGEIEQLLELFDDAVVSGLEVTAPGGMFVRVNAPGHAFSEGLWSSHYANESLAISANATGNPRYDMVYIVFNNGSATPPYKTYAAIVEGTAAAVPEEPAFNVANATGVVLARVLVNDGASAITTGNITDRRAFSAPSISDGSITLAKLASEVTDLFSDAFGSKNDSTVSELDTTITTTGVNTLLTTATVPALPVDVDYKVIVDARVQAEGITALCDGKIAIAMTGQTTVTSGTVRWEHGVDAENSHFAEFTLTGDGIAKTATLYVQRSSGGTLTVRRCLVRVDASPT